MSKPDQCIHGYVDPLNKLVQSYMNRFIIDEDAQFEVIDICYYHEDQRILNSIMTFMNAIISDDNNSMICRAWKCIEFLKTFLKYIATEGHPLVGQADNDRE